MRDVRLLLLILGFAALTLDAQPLSSNIISIPEASSVSASGNSFLPVLSADGRYVVFLSTANNLVTNDSLVPYVDLFRHDLVSGETALIAAGSNTDLRTLAVSSNGQTIAFGDGTNVYCIDTYSLVRSLVSVDRNDNPPPNPVRTKNVPLSDKPMISADGRWIAFQSFATNLTSETDLNNDTDIFIRDTWSNRTALISVVRQGGATPNLKSELVDISADGNFVLFASAATNLATNKPMYNGFLELYVRDVAAGVTAWIPHPDTSFYECRWGSISADGRFVLYKVEFPPNTAARALLYDRLTGTNLVVNQSFSSSRAGIPIHMNSDARFIAYDQSLEVFLWDRQSGLRTRVGTDLVVTGYSPTVSEDGSIVTFFNAGSSSYTIYQLDYRKMSTNQQRSLTRTLSGAPSGKDHKGSSVAIHPTGEFIVFESAEDNLVPEDRNQANDIFVHFVATGETRLISRAHPEKPAFTPMTGATITNNCVSADGTRVLFFSNDSTLAPGDTNGWQDAFVRDLRSNRTFAISTDVNGRFLPTNTVLHGVLSANGRFALLGMARPRVAEPAINLPATIVRKDLDTGETLAVVSNLVPNATPSFPSPIAAMAFSISADGRWIAYPSNNVIIVADMESGTQTNLTPADPTWTDPAISSDGRYVLFVKQNPRTLAIADLSSDTRVLLTNAYTGGAAFTQDSQSMVYGSAIGPVNSINFHSIATGTDTLVCTNCWNPQASADGRYVAYQTLPKPYQVEIKDMVTGRTTRMTQNVVGTGGANRDVTWPVIGGDSRFVAYTSKATNLTTDVPNGWNNLYIYDRLQGSTIRITGAGSNSGYGSGSASRPVLGPDGRTLVFQSFASDFVANDFNDTRDIFLLKLGEGDADNDGMSDSWEQTYFSTTDRDGTGDYDQDGQSDLAEYLAGTDPTNSQSLLEVLTITSVSTGQRQLIWRAEAGKSYRVEYKTDLQGATWTGLGQVILASGPTASAIDTTAASEKRFYRVAVVQ